MPSIKELQEEIGKYGREKGWTIPDEGEVPHKLMLIVTEAAEAMEDYRKGLDLRAVVVEESGKPTGFPTELADIVIRTIHLAENLGIDLDDEVRRKQDYNWTRPYRHGGKRA